MALARALETTPWSLTTVTPEDATLADLRCWRGLSQAELAERSGLVRTTYAAVERGELPLRPDVASRIAKALGRGTTTADVEAAYRRAGNPRDIPQPQQPLQS
ncbi:MAG: helix-turn-helix domain-containing protein [Actinomycetota bacterium]|nr:helix-turn-helix domain-containing protein [Actinomycetota bacterium]